MPVDARGMTPSFHRRYGRRLALFLGALALIVAAASIIVHFRAESATARRAELASAHVQQYAYALSAAEWQVVAEGRLSSELREALSTSAARGRDALPNLGADSTSRASADRYEQYLDAVEDEVRLVDAKDFEAAEELDEKRVDPLFGSLSGILKRVAAEKRQVAEEAELRGDILTATTLLILLGAIALLLWVEYQRQRRSEARRAQELDWQARHDPLTGLPNRRPLFEDLEAATTQQDARRLVMFDLDGFKTYNDTFGHPEGDLLLKRLSSRLRRAVADVGSAYRLGGDEFCVLIPYGDDARIAGCLAALTETTKAMEITACYGVVEIPSEASGPAAALMLADERLYANKASGRSSAHQQTRDLALRILAEDQPFLSEHVSVVAGLASAVGVRLGLDEVDLHNLTRVAELHDLGEVALPDAVLEKPGPLDEDEWELIRRHTIIGERILAAAPALAPLAPLVRSTHERWDGHGYPDGLKGEDIPLLARIVFACGSYNAIVSPRPYSPAKSKEEAEAELKAGSGSQFDPQVVEALITVLAEPLERHAHLRVVA